MASGSGAILLIAIIGGIIFYFLFKNSKSLSLSRPSSPSQPSTGGGTPTATTGGGTIYPAVSHYSIANPGGQNQNITYASSGKAAISHRCDVNGTSDPHQEATVCLAWPSNCTGGGHPELAVKFWGPGHTDSSCCYAYIAAVPQGGNLQLAFGGEGPHPSTTTIEKPLMTIPFQAGKTYCFKGVIWPLPGGGAHQEMYYDETGSNSNYKLAGKWDRPTVGQNKTSTTIAPGAQVEFRIDCSNITYSHTDVAVIRPPGAALARARAREATSIISETRSAQPGEQEDCGCDPTDPNDCTSPVTTATAMRAGFRFRVSNV